MTKKINDKKLENIFNCSILVIEHSSVTRSVISNSLKDYGFKNINKATSCDHAIDLLRDRAKVFDLITSDFDESDMPFELFLSRLRSINKLDGMAFLIISDKLDLESASKLLSLNVEKFLKKPFTSEEICKVTKDTLTEHLYPDEYTKNCRTAVDLLNMKKYDEAEILLLETMDLTAVPTNALYFRGHVAIIRGNVKKAKEIFLRALELKDNHIKSLIGLSFCATNLKDQELLYDTSKKILKIDQYHVPSIQSAIKGSIMFKDYDLLMSQLKRIRFSYLDNELMKEFISINAQNIFISVINSDPEELDLKLVFTLFKECFYEDTDKYVSLLELFSNYNYTSLVINEITELKQRGHVIDELILFKIDINTLFNDENFDSVILECKRFLNKGKPNHYVYEMLIDSFIAKNDNEEAKEVYSNALSYLSKTEVLLIKERFSGVLSI